ncbi:MAG: DUF2271 domain-containing protein [Hyphomonadaceae bacterium]
MILFSPELLFDSAPLGVDRPALAVAAEALSVFQHAGVLGTRLNLAVHAEDPVEAARAEQRVLARIAALDRTLNWRDPASELSRLNASLAMTASPDLFAVVEAAENWRIRSGGAFSGRLGRIHDLWRDLGRASRSTPDRAQLARLAAEADRARVELDPADRTIVHPDAVRFDLDAVAKGYIVDRALEAAMQSPAIRGALLDIGGDIRCAGAPPGAETWFIGLPDPLHDVDNAPLLGGFSIRDRAVATSGFGPRTLGAEAPQANAEVDASPLGTIINPRSGWPAPRRRSATVVADTAAEADALATTLVALSVEDGRDIIRSSPNASARVSNGVRADWLSADATGAPPPEWIPVQAKPPGRSVQTSPAPGEQTWPEGWVAYTTFQAPPRQRKRDPSFRSPYVAIWISDADNRPIRTLLLVGTIKEWHQDNFIWWSLNRGRAMQLLAARSMSTRGSGEYRVLWDGADDAGKMMPAGKYVMHVETSRERGRHTHRSLVIDATGAKTSDSELPQTEEAGGLSVSFLKY